jgi:hypothetical protein
MTLLLEYGKSEFWGSIRTLKVTFTMTLIHFTLTPLLTIFLTIMSNLSQADVFNGEGFYGNHLSLKATETKNP